MSRTLLQQALDALRQCEFTSPPAQRPIVKDAITALREALAAPPAAPAVPLTEEEILRIKGQFRGTLDVQFVDFARAIEKAHGIGGGNG